MHSDSPDLVDDEHRELYIKLTEEEEKVEKELETLISRNLHLESKVKNIVKVLPNLEIISSDAKQLMEMISFASTLAENVSCKVRKLDTARARVSECQQRVHDLLDLQLCCDGVQKSMTQGDYEKAAAHIHRYLSMDQRLLEKTADDVNQDSVAVNNSITLLQDAANKLRDILTIKFNEAVVEEDVASVERFFKLFPLIDMHDHGLEKFSLFLAAKIQTMAKKNLKTALETSASDKRAGVLYSDVLTLLFEGIARIIEVHQPLVETYYGPGRLLKLVTNLQNECDNQCKIILKEFRRNRQIVRLTATIREKNRSTSLSSTSSKLDPKDLDQLLAEITIMHSRYNLYLKFLRRKVAGDTGGSSESALNNEAATKELDEKLKSSELCRLIQELLDDYLLLEHYYMEESVKKAIGMDTCEPGSPISSMIDDVFFIVKKCIRRASATANIDGVCAVINNACTVLETEMCATLLNTMKLGFPSGYLDLTQAYNVVMQGRLQANDTEQAKTTFISHLNNTEIGADYVGTLVTSLVNEVDYNTEHERRKLESCLAGLSSVSAALSSAQELGMHQLRNTAIKPRIATWMDAFLTVSHALSEEEFSSYEANEPFLRSFIGNLDNLLSEFRLSLALNNFENLVGIVASEVNLQFEKVILKSEFNRLGGLALDKEVRALVSYLSKATSWSVRDKFARITQIATVLNMERVSEVTDYWGTSPLPLTPADLKKIMKLRVDFPSEEIARLKL